MNSRSCEERDNAVVSQTSLTSPWRCFHTDINVSLHHLTVGWAARGMFLSLAALAVVQLAGSCRRSAGVASIFKFPLRPLSTSQAGNRNNSGERAGRHLPPNLVFSAVAERLAMWRSCHCCVLSLHKLCINVPRQVGFPAPTSSR